MRWMLYGATGYTGQLVAEEAVRRGQQPVIAGRDVDKLRALSERLDLEYAAFHLDDISTIAQAIADVDVVYHAAGPFIHTSDPMIRACLATSTHYLDITGDIKVFLNTFRYDDAARKNGIVLISGVGFDVVPTDCLAVYVAGQVSAASTLEIGFMAFSGMSAGTSKALLEMLPNGGKARVDGKLITVPFGHRTRTLTLPNGEHPAVALPWGDLVTAYRSTGIPNITTYIVLPQPIIMLARLTAPVGRRLANMTLAKSTLERAIERFVDGPDENTRTTGRSYLWAQASTSSGHSAEAWLETLEPYQFTAQVALHAVEQVLSLNLSGALSPAQAFGANFVLNVADSRRLDHLD